MLSVIAVGKNQVVNQREKVSRTQIQNVLNYAQASYDRRINEVPTNRTTPPHPKNPNPSFWKKYQLLKKNKIK